MRQAVEILPYQLNFIPYKCELDVNFDNRNYGNLMWVNVMNVVHFGDI
jgi:hypothetical protein